MHKKIPFALAEGIFCQVYNGAFLRGEAVFSGSGQSIAQLLRENLLNSIKNLYKTIDKIQKASIIYNVKKRRRRKNEEELIQSYALGRGRPLN